MQADLERARGLQQQGEIDRAAAIYQQILAEQPDHREARHLLAVADLQIGVAEVVVVAGLARDLGDECLEAVDGADRVPALDVGDQPAAAGAFDKAAELAPDNADFCANAATVHMALGQTDVAERGFVAALRLDGEHFHSRHNLGSLLAAADRPAEALEHLERAAVHPACGTETLRNLARVYERLGRSDDAARVLKQADGARQAAGDLPAGPDSGRA